MATKKQMIERAEDIEACLRRGESIGDFEHKLSVKHKCSKRSIQKQYRAIINELANIQKDNREQLRAELVMRSNHLYNLALEKGNIKNAIDAVNQQAKLTGLYLPAKEDSSGEEAPIFQFKKVDNSKPFSVVQDDEDEPTRD